MAICNEISYYKPYMFCKTMKIRQRCFLHNSATPASSLLVFRYVALINEKGIRQEIEFVHRFFIAESTPFLAMSRGWVETLIESLRPLRV